MFTPEYVFNLVAGSPQGRAMVESLAKMNQLNQMAQQFGPQIQQFANNPMGAMNAVGNWAQNMMNSQQVPQAAQAQAPQQEVPQQPQPSQQQGESQMPNGVMGMAMEMVNEFKTTLSRIEETQKQIMAAMELLANEILETKKEIKDLKQLAAKKDPPPSGKSAATDK